MLQPIKIVYNCDVIIFNEKITFRASVDEINPLLNST